MERGETEDKVCFKRCLGPHRYFPWGSCSTHFVFLLGRASNLHTLSSADFPPLIFCGSVAGRLHTGERKEMSHGIGWGFGETAALSVVSGTGCLRCVASSSAVSSG